MKKSSFIPVFVFAALVTIPYSAFADVVADTSHGIGTFATLINNVTDNVVSALATLFLSLALVVFFYGIVQYIWGRQQGNGDKVKVGNDFMTWGLVALFVMFSVYGIIKLGQNIFGFKDVSTIEIPRIRFNTSGSSSGNTNQPIYNSPSSPASMNGQAPSSPNSMNGGGGYDPKTNTNNTTNTGAVQSNASNPCANKSNGDSCVINGQNGWCSVGAMGIVCIEGVKN